MTANAIEFHETSLRYPPQRYPSLKEWGVNLLRGRSATRDGFVALREITLDIAVGEATAIIGANGAGKSTLLRLAAGVIPPTDGHVVVRGRVAPLLELGTGFDMELSGRENVLFNGALLGRTRAEMLRRFDEIVDFSGLEKFIDAPLRTYSTGMVSRLAFSIATSVDADVVLIDEILSVGDAEFRTRCEQRIRSYARGGATLVVVSHEMDSVRRLCSRAIWIGGGRMLASGDTAEVVAAYEQSLQPRAMEDVRPAKKSSARPARFEIERVDPCYLAPSQAVRVEIDGQFPDGPLQVEVGSQQVEVVSGSKSRLVVEAPALPPAEAFDVSVSAGDETATVRRAIVTAPLDVPLTHPFARWVEVVLRNEQMYALNPGSFGVDFPAELPDLRHALLVGIMRRETDATDAAANLAAVKVLVERCDRERREATGGENVPLRRREVAALLLKAKHGASFNPPPAEGIFADVPKSDSNAAYIEQLYREKITSGCAESPLRFCPDALVTRGQLAKFIATIFS